MPSNKKMTGLRLNDVMYAKIKHLSEADGRTISNFIERIVIRYIEEYEREHGPIITTQNDKD